MGTFDGDDELGDDWQYFVAALVQEVVGAQDGEGSIGVDFLSASIEEDGQVVVVVEGFY